MDCRLSFIVNVEERAEKKFNERFRLNEQNDQALRRKLCLKKLDDT